MIKVLLLEDEEYNREFLKQILKEVVGIAEIFDVQSGKEAIDWALENHPHIALLDIELTNQKENGLDVARAISQSLKDTYIVFVTGYSKYAVDSFDVHPYGYILKPIKIPKFQELIAEIVYKIKHQNQLISDVFTVRIKNEMLHINYKDIIFIEVENHKSIIHTKGATWEMRKGLDEIEGMLGPDFLRVHRSFIVNLTKIKKTKETYDRSYEIEFMNYSKTALMSRYYYPKYREHFEP
ncbi:MAG: DNA-binding response regulator [Firmicutes bacterium HGW-Firmicutes-15]|nr:MAG: DNA-binding response regulator [Firmicutes bacterium HGW-Firmicutes-15]